MDSGRNCVSEHECQQCSGHGADTRPFLHSLDPERHFGTVKCRSAKGLFDHYVGAAERINVTCPCRAADLLLLVKPAPIWITLKSKQWFASPILCATPCTSRTGLAAAGRFSLLRGPAALMSRPRRQKGKATQLAQPGRAAPMGPGGSYRGKTGPRPPVVGAAVDDPERHFAAVNYRIAKGAFALGRPMPASTAGGGRSTAGTSHKGKFTTSFDRRCSLAYNCNWLRSYGGTTKEPSGLDRAFE
jgi:hypothetical protein